MMPFESTPRASGPDDGQVSLALPTGSGGCYSLSLPVASWRPPCATARGSVAVSASGRDGRAGRRTRVGP